MHRTELIIIDGDGWWCFGILSQDVGLLRLMVRLNPRQAWVKWSISVCRFALGVGRYCRIVSKQHVSDDGFTYFGHDSEAGEIEKPAI